MGMGIGEGGEGGGGGGVREGGAGCEGAERQADKWGTK